MEKRIEQIINHLLGTKLPMSAAMTTLERNDATFCAMVLSRIQSNSETLKWEKHVTS